MNVLPKAIVMIDDEKSYVDLLAAMLLENLGCPVFTFTRPRDALAALPGLNPGVVVTDYHMPQMNGFDLVRQAAPLVPDVPFILITGHSLHLVHHDLPEGSPLRAILPKPFGWRRLAEEIARHAPEFTLPPTKAGFTPSSF